MWAILGCLALVANVARAQYLTAVGTCYLNPFPGGIKPKIFTGIGDITGPVVETNMMGYAVLAQTDTGLHMRSAHVLSHHIYDVH